MNRYSIVIALILGFSMPANLMAGYGDPVNGYPSQTEREIFVLTNAVRTAPVEFRNTYIGSYNILLPENYPAVEPVFYNYQLNFVARLHSQDMAENNFFSHDSFDGTSTGDRIISYYTPWTSWGENIVAGSSYSTGLLPLILLLRENSSGEPVPDKSGQDGHRANIMSSNFHELGAGYAYSVTSDYKNYWTQDFGRAYQPYPYYAIPSGSHLYLISNTISFMATFFDPDGSPPQSAKVIINNLPYDLSLHMGSQSMGTYLLELPNDVDCRDYFFQFQDAGGTLWRFPETTALTNNLDKTCISYSLAELIRVLQVVSGRVPVNGNMSADIDINDDQRVGLAEAIHILRMLGAVN